MTVVPLQVGTLEAVELIPPREEVLLEEVVVVVEEAAEAAERSQRPQTSKQLVRLVQFQVRSIQVPGCSRLKISSN